jgi:hypothetical protein
MESSPNCCNALSRGRRQPNRSRRSHLEEQELCAACSRYKCQARGPRSRGLKSDIASGA